MRVFILILGVIWATMSEMYWTVGLIMLGVWFVYECVKYANEAPAERIVPRRNPSENEEYNPATGYPMSGAFDAAGNLYGDK